MKSISCFGERLKGERKKRNWTQEKLAEKLANELAEGKESDTTNDPESEQVTSGQTISAYEKGSINPPFSKVIALANLLNVSIDYLCGEDEPELKPEPEIKLQTIYDVVKILERLDVVLPCEFSHEEIETDVKGRQSLVLENGETVYANIDYVSIIKIHNYELANFISGKNNILKILEEVAYADPALYDTWYSGAIGEIKDEPLHKKKVLRWSKDAELKIKKHKKSLKEQNKAEQNGM